MRQYERPLAQAVATTSIPDPGTLLPVPHTLPHFIFTVAHDWPHFTDQDNKHLGPQVQLSWKSIL